MALRKCIIINDSLFLVATSEYYQVLIATDIPTPSTTGVNDLFMEVITQQRS